MAGLLDLLNTPESQLGIGLLAAAGQGRSLGEGLLGAAQNVQRQQQQQAIFDWQNAQIQRQKGEWGRLDRERELAKQFYKPATPGLSPLMGDPNTGILPSAGTPGVPSSFNMRGYADALMAEDPISGMKIMQELQKEMPVDKISPEKFTPQSLAKFAQTRNYSDLVPRDKLEFVEGVGVNPFNPANENRSIPNPNKPFSLDAQGNAVPNSAFQDYEVRKAAAGASRTNNNVSVNTEKSLLDTVASGVGKQVDASLAQARGAADSLRTIGNLKDALNSGKVMAGPATKPAMLLTQLGAQLGIVGKDSQETLQKTRAAMQQMAQLELDAAVQMRGQGQITENERDIIRKAASGEISMTLPELKTLAASLEKTAIYRINRHNQNIQPLLSNPNAAALAPFLTVQPPSQTAPANPGGGWKILGVQ